MGNLLDLFSSVCFVNFAYMFCRLRILIPVFILFLTVSIACGDKKNIERENEAKNNTDIANSEVNLLPVAPGTVRRLNVNIHGTHGTIFSDSNHTQLEMARLHGIDPITDLNSAYFMKRPLVKVESNQYYKIDSLKHSLPYLVPEAAILLQDIGKNFIDSLHARGGDSYTIKVTSLLRTPETVGKLRRVNINATDSSTHQYATTFDISYYNFNCLDENRLVNQNDLKNLLAEVLYDLREQGRCLVKYERKTGCFHITVAK